MSKTMPQDHARTAHAGTMTAVLAGLFFLLATARPAPLPAQLLQPDVPDFRAILRAEADRLPLIASDEAALALFRGTLLRNLDLEPSLTSPEERPSAGRPAAETREVAEAAVRLVADLAAWQLASRAERADDRPVPGVVPDAAQRAGQHRAWVLAKGERPALRQALAAIEEQPTATNAGGDGASPSPTKLAAVQAQLEAERDTLLSWIRLRSASERVKTLRGLTRLCGTWLWTVHNHQNHQDHKSQIVFPPPDAVPSTGSGPKKILIVGDTVYLRWEFRGGFQEDSLLLAGGGQRLEGTFVNSAGAWGSITGKRTAGCGKASDSPPAAR